MNTIGKILVVVILLESVVFMAAAIGVYSTHKNWAEQADSLRQTVTQLRAEKADLDDRLAKLNDDLENERTARAEQIAKLETENDQLIRTRDELQQTRAELVTARDQAVTAMQAAQQTTANLRTEVTQLREDIRAAEQERNAKFREVVELTDTLHQTEGEVERLQTSAVQLNEDVTRYEALLERANIDLETPIDDSPPRIDGRILATRDGGWVEVSLGRDDGLRRGHKLEVFRTNKYLGRIEIVATEPDRAVGRIMKNYQQGAIQRDDYVASQLN